MSRYLGRSKNDPDYGMGEHSIDVADLGLIGEKELTSRLVETFQSPSYKPPRLPTTAMELMSISQRPDVLFDEIETLLEQDAMLAGEILSVARSAFYTRTHEVQSMREALVLLGLDKLRQIVMQAAMDVRVFRSAAYAGVMDRLRLHSRAVAHVSRILSLYTPISEEQAFLCGLMHDVGIAGVLLILGDVPRGEEAPDLALLWPAIDAAHPSAGARMVQLWDLPAEIALAVEAHHSVRTQGFDHPLAASVCLAEQLVADLDLGLLPGEAEAQRQLGACGLIEHGRIDRCDERALTRAREALGLSDPLMEQVRRSAEQWLQAEAAASA